MAAFLGSVEVRDQVYERSLKANVHRIQAGMSAANVVSILGEPTSKNISDIPGVYWCYGSSTWDRWSYGEVYCGEIIFEMSDHRGGHVVSPPKL